MAWPFGSDPYRAKRAERQREWDAAMEARIVAREGEREDPVELPRWMRLVGFVTGCIAVGGWAWAIAVGWEALPDAVAIAFVAAVAGQLILGVWARVLQASSRRNAL